jgi:hypothetical protein
MLKQQRAVAMAAARHSERDESYFFARLQCVAPPYFGPSVQHPDFMHCANFASQPGPRESQIAFQAEHDDAPWAIWMKPDVAMRDCSCAMAGAVAARPAIAASRTKRFMNAPTKCVENFDGERADSRRLPRGTQRVKYWTAPCASYASTDM